MRRLRVAGLAQAAVLTLALAGLAGGCGGDGGASPAAPADSEAGAPRLVTLHDGLSAPWGLAFLPDGRLLVTEKSGRLLRLSADGRRTEAVIRGVPPVVSAGQGGLLDVAVDPEFARNGRIYLSYAERGNGAEANLSGTAVARARLVGDALEDVTVIYRQVPKVSGSGHFGSRFAFGPEGLLYVSLGERQKETPAQDLRTTLGKIIRIRTDGSVPPGNPSLGPDARPEIWSYGHRNPQGLAWRPGTGQLWNTEHGPQGGDELNRVQPGANYGWPVVSYGCPYGSPVGDECRIGGGTHAPRFVEPVSYWVPVSTAPSALMFYTGDRFPAWRGNAFTGALAGQTLWRIVLDGDREVSRDEPLAGQLSDRVRALAQGPDGWIYLLTDSGRLQRIQR